MITDLKEIIRVINRKRLDKIDVFIPDYNKKEDTKQELYRYFSSNKVTKEKDVLTLLGFKNRTDKAYLMYLSRFKYSVLNLMFFLDLKNSHKEEIINIEYKILKFSMLARILYLAKARKTALKFYQKAIVIARKNNFAKLYADSMLGYLGIAARLNIGSNLNKYIEEYPKIRKWADDLEILEYNLVLVINIIITKKIFKKDNTKKIENCLKLSRKIKNNYHDIRIEEIKFLMEYYYYSMIFNTTKVEKTCLRYEAFLINSSEARAKHFIQVAIALIKIYATTYKYEKGINIYNKYNKYFNKSIQSYSVFNEAYINLLLLKGNYIKAKEILKEVYSLIYFKEYMSQKEKELLLIYEPFVLFAIDPKLLSMKKFIDFKHLITNNLYFAQNKKKMNFNFLLAHYLFLLSLKDFDGLIELSITFKNYNYKYFKKTKNKRIYYFIKMLYVLYKTNFNIKLSKLKNENNLEKMKIIKRGSFHEEIIPFEKLWPMILRAL